MVTGDMVACPVCGHEVHLSECEGTSVVRWTCWECLDRVEVDLND